MENEHKPLNSDIKSFTDLECWKACREVRNRFSGIIKSLPAEEKYALADGMRRASRSITENIAEGYGRFHFQENIQFCRHSRGSLFELKDQLITAYDENYLSKAEVNQTNELIDKALSLLNGYINYLARVKSTASTKNNLAREPYPSYHPTPKGLLPDQQCTDNG
jgi:four helix bundle protein